VPHFQVVLGGMWEQNAGSYGLAIGAVPSKRIPEALDRLTSRYLAERSGGETFRQWTLRIGKGVAKAMLEDLMTVPAHDADRSYYVDWADAREYTIGDLGVGECAGEVVSPIEFALAASEREAFEAQLALEAGDRGKAARGAYEAMLHCAEALVRQVVPTLTGNGDTVVEKFRERFYDTQLFFDPFAGGKFAQYFFAAHARRDDARSAERAHQLVEEAQLFIEAAHACHARMLSGQARAAN
jgi:sulfite reductase (ferredoxin)